MKTNIDIAIKITSLIAKSTWNEADKDFLDSIHQNYHYYSFMYDKLQAQSSTNAFIFLYDNEYLHMENKRYSPVFSEANNEGMRFYPYLSMLHYVSTFFSKNINDSSIIKKVDSLIIRYIEFFSNERDSLGIEPVSKLIFQLPLNHINDKHWEFLISSCSQGRDNSLISDNYTKLFFPRLLSEKVTEKLWEQSLSFLLGAQSSNPSQEKFSPNITHFNLEQIIRLHSKNLSNKAGEIAINIAESRLRKISSYDIMAYYLSGMVGGIVYIGEDEQNRNNHSYESQMVIFLREQLLECQEKIFLQKKITAFFDSDIMILMRLAFFIVDKKYDEVNDLFWSKFKDSNPLNNNSSKLELYRLLENNHAKFSDDQKAILFNWIKNLAINPEEDLNIIGRRKAYKQLEWLSSLKLFIENPSSIFFKLFSKIKTEYNFELEHPGYNSWFSMSSSSHPFPLSSEESQDVEKHQITQDDSIQEVVEKLRARPYFKLSVFYYSEDFRNYVLQNAETISNQIGYFESEEYWEYYHNLFSAFEDAWENGQQLNWRNIFQFAKRFFKNCHESEKIELSSIIRSVAWLIKKGCQDDENSFDTSNIPLVENVLLLMSEKISGPLTSETTPRKDYTFDVINSGCGSLYQSMIFLSLFNARQMKDISPSKTNKWLSRTEYFFTTKLVNKESVNDIYFLRVIGMYLPQIGYLNLDWIRAYKSSLFPKNEESKFIFYHIFGGYLVYPKKIYKSLFDLLTVEYSTALSIFTEESSEAKSLIDHIKIASLENYESAHPLIEEVLKAQNNLHFKYFIQSISNKRQKYNVETIKEIWRQILGSTKNKEALKTSLDIIAVIPATKIDSDVLSIVEEINSRIDSWTFPNSILFHFFWDFKEKLNSRQANIIGQLFYLLLEKVATLPYFRKDSIFQLVQNLYDQDNIKTANLICERIASKGDFFLVDLFKKYNSQENLK